MNIESLIEQIPGFSEELLLAEVISLSTWSVVSLLLSIAFVFISKKLYIIAKTSDDYSMELAAPGAIVCGCLSVFFFCLVVSNLQGVVTIKYAPKAAITNILLHKVRR
jgi:hypothetical protein